MADFDQRQTGLRTELYTLKHKDLDVAVVQVNDAAGTIEYVLAVYTPEDLPVGCLPDGRFLREWWNERAIPDTRRGIAQARNYLNESTNQTLMLAGYGLGLTDYYWLQPLDQEAYWKDINYFANPFSEKLGDLLTETGDVDLDGNISRFSPSSSVNGEMKKKWVIRGGLRYLMKVNFNDYGQQAVNEAIACRLHQRSGWENYARYSLETVLAEGKEYPCSLSLLFTSEEREFVSAYQLIRGHKVPNETSQYEIMIELAARHGIPGEDVRRQLEYTILTDFVLSNTDRHYNNFGFLRDPADGSFTSMAPIFDTGNSLFYDRDIIPTGEYLLDIKAASFRKREVDMLQYVKDCSLLDLDRLSGFPEEVFGLLTRHTDMPGERAERIAGTVEAKIKYLDRFYQGEKIWKRDKYR